MAVKFFRMSEKGSIKRPTLVALGCFFSSAIAAMFFLHEHPFLCVFIAWPILYFFFAIMLSSPFRVTLGKVMHWTRYHTIMSIPTPADKAWLEANHRSFKKTGIKMYLGEPMEKKADSTATNETQTRNAKKATRRIKVIYEDGR